MPTRKPTAELRPDLSKDQIFSDLVKRREEVLASEKEAMALVKEAQKIARERKALDKLIIDKLGDQQSVTTIDGDYVTQQTTERAGWTVKPFSFTTVTVRHVGANNVQPLRPQTAEAPKTRRRAG